MTLGGLATWRIEIEHRWALDFGASEWRALARILPWAPGWGGLCPWGCRLASGCGGCDVLLPDATRRGIGTGISDECMIQQTQPGG